MATADDLDPIRMQRVASEKLQQSLENLDRHIEALTAPTMELALIRAKQASAAGLEEIAPSSLTRRFVSSATTPGIGTPREPGQIGPDASDAGLLARTQWDEMTGGPMLRPGTPFSSTLGSARGPSPIAGKTNIEAQRLEEEQIRIPQFGDWQLDTIFKLASQISGKRALSNYEEYSTNERTEGRIPMDAAKWLESQGPLAAGKVSGAFASLSEKAVPFNILHQRVLRPLMDIGFGASNVGATLGYSPQGEGLGGGFLGASHYLGIPNPIASFTSPAGRQGLGSVVNAAEAAIGGTGIGIGEANSLRQALIQQGWSNQRSGGLLGLTVGGEQETLALALEPLMKKGFKNPEVLAEFTSALKLGTGNISELTEGIENLASTAKMTHQTLESEAVKAQEFMAKAVEGGATMIHGLTAYGEIAKTTKMNPLLIQQINEGQFGQIQALSKGIMPWEIQGMSGNAAATNAYETYKRVAGYVPKQTDTRSFNKVTGEWEVTETAAEKEAGYIHMLEPSITAEEAKRFHKIGPQLEAVAGGLSQGREIHRKQFVMEGYNQANNAAARAYAASIPQRTAQEHHIAALKARLKNHPNGEENELEAQIEEAEENLQPLKDLSQQAAKAAMNMGHLNKNQQASVRKELEGPKGLYATAKAAGVNATELQKIHKESLEKQTGSLMHALEGINKVNIESEKEENAKIELAPDAKAFFRLKFPTAAKKAEANEGGPSIQSRAASPNSAGEGSTEASLKRSMERAMRQEPINY